MSEGNARSKPNFVTCNYLLRSQIIAYRYNEAKETLALILNAASMIERPALVSFASNSRQESTNFESPAPTIPASCINTQQNSQV